VAMAAFSASGERPWNDGVPWTRCLLPWDLLTRRLSHFAPLSGPEMAFLNSLASGSEDLPAGTDLIREGEALDSPRLLLAAGRAVFARFPTAGARYSSSSCQESVRVLPSAAGGGADDFHCTDARRRCRRDGVGRGHHENAGSNPGLTRACYATASLEEAYLLSQLMRVGRQTAFERTAHFLLEIHERLAIVGLAGETTVRSR